MNPEELKELEREICAVGAKVINAGLYEVAGKLLDAARKVSEMIPPEEPAKEQDEATP